MRFTFLFAEMEDVERNKMTNEVSASSSPDTRPLLVLCEACGSEGRLLTSDGGPYDTDNGPCPYCSGTGLALVESEPVTLEDLGVVPHGGPTEAHPDRPYCKPDQSCCDFCCGN
jgi:hypothetical protein